MRNYKLWDQDKVSILFGLSFFNCSYNYLILATGMQYNARQISDEFSVVSGVESISPKEIIHLPKKFEDAKLNQEKVIM